MKLKESILLDYNVMTKMVSTLGLNMISSHLTSQGSNSTSNLVIDSRTSLRWKKESRQRED